jgi:hypothetical protein
MMSEPDNRSPIYGEKNRQIRVVSFPYGQWQCQRHGDDKGSRTYDPWRPLQEPTTFENAFGKLTNPDQEEREWREAEARKWRAEAAA